MTEPDLIQVRDTNERPSWAVIAARTVYFLGGALLALLALRFLLALLGAAEGSLFVNFIYGLSGIFVMPFYGVFGEPTYGTSQVETSTVIAMLVYGLLTIGAVRLITLGSRHAEEV